MECDLRIRKKTHTPHPHTHLPQQSTLVGGLHSPWYRRTLYPRRPLRHRPRGPRLIEVHRHQPLLLQVAHPRAVGPGPEPRGLGGRHCPSRLGSQGLDDVHACGAGGYGHHDGDVPVTGRCWSTWRQTTRACRQACRQAGRGDGGQGQVTSRSPESAQHCVNGGKGVAGQCCTTGRVVNQGCQWCATRESTCAGKQRPSSQRTNSIMPPPPCLQTRLPTMAQGQCSCVRPNVHGSGHSMGGGGGGTSATWAELRGRVRRRRRRR
jgi:hypothetical protein